MNRSAVTMYNPGELTPRVVLPGENREFPLKPKSVGCTLYSWESDWVTAQLEAELKGWLDQLGTLLKRWDNPLSGEQSPPTDL